MKPLVWVVSKRGDGWIAIEHRLGAQANNVVLSGETGRLFGFLTLAETEAELRSRELSPWHPVRDRLQAKDPTIIAVWW